jgi:hypothetical protein
MKKLLTGIAVALFAGALAVPASASVDAIVWVNVTKMVDINENINKLKDVDVDVFFDNDLIEGAAEALSLVNQENVDNFADVILDGEEGVADDALNALIEGGDVGGSISGNNGITQVNQDVGVGANQGNLVALAVTNAVTSFADAQSTVDQRNQRNMAILDGPFTPDNPERTAVITDSVNGNIGITQVNQNAGNWVNQANAASVALGDAEGAVLALADAFLGQVNSGNVVDAFVTTKQNDLLNSVNGNTGITSVNQATGNNINQGTAISFSGIAALGLGGNVSSVPSP